MVLTLGIVVGLLCGNLGKLGTADTSIGKNSAMKQQLIEHLGDECLALLRVVEVRWFVVLPGTTWNHYPSLNDLFDHVKHIIVNELISELDCRIKVFESFFSSYRDQCVDTTELFCGIRESSCLVILRLLNVTFFDELGVATEDSDMSFAVSINQGKLEYSGVGLKGLFSQKSNMAKPSFWKMINDLNRLDAILE